MKFFNGTEKRHRVKTNPQVRVPFPIWFLIGIVCLASFLTPNPALFSASIIVLPFFALAVLRRAEPPILFVILGIQWTQVVTKVVHAQIKGMTVEELYRNQLYEYSFFLDFDTSKIILAVWLSLAGLLVLAIGMRFGVRRLQFPRLDQLKSEAGLISPEKLLLSYGLFYVAEMIVFSFIWQESGLYQFFRAVFNLKKVIIMLLGYHVFMTKKKRHYFFTIFFIEIIVGATSYFSEFKEPIFILAAIYLTLGYKFNFKNVTRILSLSLLVLLMAVSWTAIKTEYRKYIDQVAIQDQTAIPFQERLKTILSLYRSIELSSFGKELEKFAERLAYVDFFAMVLSKVPDEIPFQNGEITQAAIKHVMMPRLFFPQKGSLQDTELATAFTDIEYQEHTSVSLGYMAELYVDFGIPKLFIGVLILGFLWGWIYRYFINRSKYKLLGYCISITVLFSAMQFEMNIIKLLGTVLSNFIVMALIMKFLSPSIMRFFMTKSVVYSYQR